LKSEGPQIKQKAATGADAVTALYDPKHGNPQEKTARR
jgi:hypothetical protein